MNHWYPVGQIHTVGTLLRSMLTGRLPTPITTSQP